MKICWDNLEGIYLTKNEFFRKGRNGYIYEEVCAKCGESYLTLKCRPSKFCGHSCAGSGENHYLYGKTHTVEEIKKISEGLSNYKGGICILGLTVYDTYKDRLGVYEDVRKQEGAETLEARCAYCGVWYPPTSVAVNSRLTAVNSLIAGECRLYCSENCKQACPTYNQKTYPKGFKKATSREVSTYLRQMVFERDGWICQKCGNTIENAPLHVHHMDPVAQNPMFQNDMDSCITLCKECHKEVHMQYGCRYVDLRCKNVFKKDK